MLLLFGTLEMSVLWAMSIFFICLISSDEKELTFFCKDNFIVNILFIVVIIAILFFLKKKSVIGAFCQKLEDDNCFKKIKSTMLWIIAIIGFVWVVITQYVPGSDQLDVMSSAYKYGAGETSMVEAGGYLDSWPHNIGITTIERILAFLVGDYNAMFMQLLNVAGIVLIYKKMVETWEKVGGSRLSQICTLASGIVFYPLIMYASFVYGNIWSLTFALIAFDAEIDFFDKKRNIDIAKCAIAMALSFMVKGSGMIFLVAAIIVAIVKLAVDRTVLIKGIVLIIMSCISVIVISAVPKSILIKTTGYEIRDDGIWAFLAMGLQEDGTTAGWYNGYCLNVYYDNNRDTVMAEETAKEEAINRVKYLLSDKHNAFEFFSKKVASTWIEPTYQGYWINQVRTHRVNFPTWLDAFMSAKGYTVAARVFNFFLIFIFTGTILWLIFEDKTRFFVKSIYFLNFVGGFTFLLFWETKAQYAITYFILLFPYAFNGYEMLLERGRDVLKTGNAFNKTVAIYCVAVALLYLVGYRLDASNCLSQHNDEYNAYLKQWQQPFMDESILEINYMKADLKTEQERNANYLMQLEEYSNEE